MHPVKLIIFDLDGTLVDSKKDIIDSANFTLRALGIPEKDGAEITSYIGTGVKDLVKKSLGEHENGNLDRALSIFEGYYREHATDTTKLFPGVGEVLEHFKDKRKMIISNKKYEFVKLALIKLGIDHFFDEVVGGDNIKCIKPASCPLDKAIADFGIENRRDVIMVGDMAIDILAGKRAKVITCAVTYGIGRKNHIEESGPDYMIDNFIELKDIIS